MDLSQVDMNSLPRNVRRQLRAKLLSFLAEIGVKPLVDADTGELMVPFKDVAQKLGLSVEEAKAALGSGALKAVPTASLKPLN